MWLSSNLHKSLKVKSELYLIFPHAFFTYYTPWMLSSLWTCSWVCLMQNLMKEERMSWLRRDSTCPRRLAKCTAEKGYTWLLSKQRQDKAIKGSEIRVSKLLLKTGNFWTQRDGSRGKVITGPGKLRKGLQSLESMEKLDAVASLCNENTLTGRWAAEVGNLLPQQEGRPELLSDLHTRNKIHMNSSSFIHKYT